jgi:hypothetical protein
LFLLHVLLLLEQSGRNSLQLLRIPSRHIITHTHAASQHTRPPLPKPNVTQRCFNTIPVCFFTFPTKSAAPNHRVAAASHHHTLLAGGAKKPGLEVWKMAGDSLTHQVFFVPFFLFQKT